MVRIITLNDAITEATDATNEGWTQRRPLISSLRDVEIVGLSIDYASLPPVPSGPTILKLASAARDANPTDTATITLAQGATYAAKVACSIKLAAGARPYLWVHQAGSHGNIELVIEDTLSVAEYSGDSVLLASEVTTGVRRNLVDEGANPQTSDATLWRWILDAERWLINLLPYDGMVGGVLVEPKVAIAGTDALNVGASRRRAIEEYVMASYYSLSLDPDAHNPVAAANHLNAALRELGFAVKGQ